MNIRSHHSVRFTAGGAFAQSTPASPVMLNIIDVAGNLQLTQAAIETFAKDNPKLISRLNFSRAPSPESVGADRARSASEAFLLRRLETLMETAGRFRLNVKLPIPFDSMGSMEVDFLCADARVVIELDGAQHLTDAQAYRRDRQKDALLQEHGFFVLRFLAEDLAKELDAVLDAILRTLAHRERRSGNGHHASPGSFA